MRMRFSLIHSFHIIQQFSQFPFHRGNSLSCFLTSFPSILFRQPAVPLPPLPRLNLCRPIPVFSIFDPLTLFIHFHSRMHIKAIESSSLILYKNYYYYYYAKMQDKSPRKNDVWKLNEIEQKAHNHDTNNVQSNGVYRI